MPTSQAPNNYAAAGGNVKKMASVASFFISRIDSLVDSMIDDKT